MPPHPANIISRPPPDAVTYDLSDPSSVRIVLPAGSTWSSGLHWHETHTEFLTVLEGSVRVRLGGEVRVVSAGEGEVRVDRGVWHEWSRADADAEPRGPPGVAERKVEDGGVVVLERTDPADRGKHVFFRGLNGVILSATAAAGRSSGGRLPGWLERLWTDVWTTLGLWVVFAEMDNFPVFVGFADLLGRWAGWETGQVEGIVSAVLGRLDWVVTHLLFWLASWVGWVVGLGRWKMEFVPRDEYERWARGRRREHREVNVEEVLRGLEGTSRAKGPAPLRS